MFGRVQGLSGFHYDAESETLRPRAGDIVKPARKGRGSLVPVAGAEAYEHVCFSPVRDEPEDDCSEGEVKFRKVLYPEDGEGVAQRIADIQERWPRAGSTFSLRKMISKELAAPVIEHKAKLSRALADIPGKREEFLNQWYGKEAVETARRWGTEDYGTVRDVVSGLYLTSREIENLRPEDVFLSISIEPGHVVDNKIYNDPSNTCEVQDHEELNFKKYIFSISFLYHNNYRYKIKKTDENGNEYFEMVCLQPEQKIKNGSFYLIGLRKICCNTYGPGCTVVFSNLKNLLEGGGKVYRTDHCLQNLVLVGMPEGVGLPVARVYPVGRVYGARPSAR